MSLGLQATKRRIASVTSTKKITKAMELVATAKLKTWKDKYQENSLYTESMIELVKDVFSKAENCESRFLTENTTNKNLFIVITSNLGLCAGYNYAIYHKLDAVLNETDDVLMIGSKGVAHYQHLGERLIKDFVSEGMQLNYETSNNVAKKILKDYLEGKYKTVKLIYTRYMNSLSFVPTEIELLPIKMTNEVQKNTSQFVIMEPSANEIVDTLIPIYVKSVLYGKLIESTVSEQASRRTAMETATDNSQDIIDKLQIEFNKERQAAITQEITEVVSGANNK